MNHWPALVTAFCAAILAAIYTMSTDYPNLTAPIALAVYLSMYILLYRPEATKR